MSGIKITFFLLVQGGYILRGLFISCFQGNKRGLECPSCTGVYKANLIQLINVPKWCDVWWCIVWWCILPPP